MSSAFICEIISLCCSSLPQMSDNLILGIVAKTKPLDESVSAPNTTRQNHISIRFKERGRLYLAVLTIGNRFLKEELQTFVYWTTAPDWHVVLSLWLFLMFVTTLLCLSKLDFKATKGDMILQTAPEHQAMRPGLFVLSPTIEMSYILMLLRSEYEYMFHFELEKAQSSRVTSISLTSCFLSLVAHSWPVQRGPADPRTAPQQDPRKLSLKSDLATAAGCRRWPCRPWTLSLCSGMLIYSLSETHVW